MKRIVVALIVSVVPLLPLGAAAGLVSDQPPHVGEVENATVHIRFDPTKRVSDGDLAVFTCKACRVVFDDGPVLEPLVVGAHGPQQQSIPIR